MTREGSSQNGKGREEFKGWFEDLTSEETPRNEFLLKLFFSTDQNEIDRLFQERLAKVAKIRDEFKQIEARLEGMAESPRRTARLKALKYGNALLCAEIKWLKCEIKY